MTFFFVCIFPVICIITAVYTIIFYSMTTLTIQVPDKYKTILQSDAQLKIITSYFIEDYLIELYQDAHTKTELENNKHDKDLNNSLKKAL